MGKVAQRDVVLIDFEPTKGHEQKGVRPAIVISSDDFAISGMIIVCPITSSIKNWAGSVVVLANKTNGLDVDSEVLVSQIRTVSLLRVIKKIGHIDQDQLAEMFANLDLLLDR
jgi:mRNA interferase MazF